MFFFFQAEDGIRDFCLSRGLGDVYKRQNIGTVGGPIDVAIISKCDGFIWLKRKHYFDRAYNPQYFYSHYMLSESEDINNGE